MDDDRTQQTLDALAELFLTEHASSPAAQAVSEAAVRQARDSIDGPEPIRLTPKAATLQAAEALRRHDDERDPFRFPPELEPLLAKRRGDDGPHLRLTDDPAEASQDDDPPREPEPAGGAVQAVLLGNLPGLAAAWLSQHAQHRADDAGGPVAVVHVDAEGADLELIEPGGGHTRPEPRRRAPGTDPQRNDLAVTLEKLAREQNLREVLVRLEPSAQGRVHDLDRWTLLSGADDFAVTAAIDQLAGLLPDEEKPHLSLVVAGEAEGGDEDRSAEAAERLAAALEIEIDTLDPLPRMAPVHAHPMGRFDRLEAWWPQLLTWQPVPHKAATVGRAPTPTATPHSKPSPEARPPVAALSPPRIETRPATQSGFFQRFAKLKPHVTPAASSAGAEAPGSPPRKSRPSRPRPPLPSPRLNLLQCRRCGSWCGRWCPAGCRWTRPARSSRTSASRWTRRAACTCCVTPKRTRTPPPPPSGPRAWNWLRRDAGRCSTATCSG